MLRVNLVPQRPVKKKSAQTTEEEKEQIKQVRSQRQFVIKTHIVKVMKARKAHKLTDLQMDVMRNIHMFRADPQMIKEQIEILIQDKYMERVPGDRSMLNYLP